MKVGSFGSTHGIKGNIKIHTTGDALASVSLPLTCEIKLQDGSLKTISIQSITPNGNTLLAKIAGFDTPESLAPLRNAVILLPKDLLPEIPEDEVYVIDLIGLYAVTKLGGESLGYQIAQVMDNPAHPILCFHPIEENREPKEILVPFLHLYVGDWDKGKKQIEVRSWELWFEV
ncbi:16S rRNA processing protein RimM [Leptospira ognonensis]|uniref:Ribosome maturation factor RimM n=1 Tax=Leptospira ognonensis TaxID=2484945 RepID=A0A4R9K0K3_9LEPT|nr:16S rRNA processing protein RimM [Leptospira ognonensis]